ncbi:11852_t:CDS:2, partial [Entrophospora sp. SA101]
QDGKTTLMDKCVALNLFTSFFDDSYKYSLPTFSTRLVNDLNIAYISQDFNWLTTSN